MENIQAYEHGLMQYTIEALNQIPNIKLYGPSNRIGIIAFNLIQRHAYDVGLFLDRYGIAIRTGHHCAMPLMSYFDVEHMCRASIAMYTNKNDIDRLVSSLVRVQYLLR